MEAGSDEPAEELEGCVAYIGRSGRFVEGPAHFSGPQSLSYSSAIGGKTSK